MSDADLKNYQLQLQQVEAALTTSPDNEDLLKLKKDLQEVIDLTKELIGGSASAAEGASSDAEASTSHAAAAQAWQVGDKCSAMWSRDNGYYPVVIDEILSDGSCTVTFENYTDTTEVTQVSLLKPYEESQRAAKRSMQDGAQGGAKKTKKDQLAAQREYKKKKNEKKRQRVKQLEEEKEADKNKWLAFNAKTFSKTSKGRVKKSIFASPDSNQGKVGVGTCGQSGQPMTAYHQNEKWKKSMQH